MIIANYYFLTAGVMALFFSVGHALWGQKYILGDVKTSAMPGATKHMLGVIWQQPTVFHAAAAVALLAASTFTNDAGADPLAVFIGVVTFGFFVNYVVTSFIKDRAALAQIVPQAVGVALYIAILAVGVSA